MTELLSEYLSQGLTSDQTEALESFKEWFEDVKNVQPFVLCGFAGSGKTFLSGRFLQLVDSLDVCWTVAAPTHKAVGVLRQSLSDQGLNATWFPSTIHRLLRLKLKRNGDTEVCEKTEQTATSLEQLGLVLIDESSMINSELLQIVLECAHNFGTRLVFVGDPAQLPPIGEINSPVFEIKRAAKAKLQEVVRHQGPVLQLASRLREGTLPCEIPPCLPAFKAKKGVVGFLDPMAWLEKAKSALKLAAEEDSPDSARILCYTNRTLERLVPHARRAIHGDMADLYPVLPGEILISRTAVMAPASINGDEAGEEPDMLLGSNRELLVSDVKKEVFDLSDFGLLKDFEWNLPSIETLTVVVSAGEMELALRLSPPVGSSSRNLLDATLRKLRVQARDAGKQEGRNYWRRFFLVRDSFASLGPASVLTVHRSQGSTFGNVFVSSDVFWPADLALRRQLAYVAITRASKAVWLVGQKGTKLSKEKWHSQMKD